MYHLRVYLCSGFLSGLWTQVWNAKLLLRRTWSETEESNFPDQGGFGVSSLTQVPGENHDKSLIRLALESFPSEEEDSLLSLGLLRSQKVFFSRKAQTLSHLDLAPIVSKPHFLVRIFEKGPWRRS